MAGYIRKIHYSFSVKIPENIANNTTTAAFKEGFSHECSSKPSHTSNKNILCFHLIVNTKL
jgi:hypothetical protein